jgi:microsomal dipeptidase-like Zn-dependent dipeptidase
MLITAYHKGFHTVLKVTPRKKDTPAQVEYQTAYDTNGKPIKGKGRVYSCAIDFCKPVTPTSVAELVTQHQSVIAALQAMSLPTVNLSKETTDSDMARRAKKRPKNYASLTGEEQWQIDKDLGILDWDGQ